MKYLGLIAILVITMSFSSAYGIVYDFTTDQSLYHKDDQLNISGNVSFDPDIPFVTIQIFTPGKLNFADFNTVPVNSDGSFSAVFHVGGPSWASDGIYPIVIIYDGSLEKSIEYVASEPEPEIIPKLTDKGILNMEKKIGNWENKTITLNGSIEKIEDKLEGFYQNNKTAKIATFEERLAGKLALLAVYTELIETLEDLIEKYS